MRLNKILQNDFFKLGISVFLFKIIGMVLGYLVMLVITRAFGSEVFGRYTITVSLLACITLVFGLGFPQSIIKYLSVEKTEEGSLKTGTFNKMLKITLVVGMPITLLFYVFSDWLSQEMFKDPKLRDYLSLGSLFIIPLLLHELWLGFYRGKTDWKRYNLFQFLLPPLGFLVTFLMLLQILQNEESTIIAFGLGICIVVLMEWQKTGFRNHNLNRVNTGKILEFSLPIMLSSVVLFLLNWTDVLMLGMMKTSREVGIYNVAFKLASVGLIVIVIANVLIGPIVVKLFENQQLDMIKTEVQKITRVIILLSIPIILALIFFRVPLLNFFGEEFIVGENAMLLLCLGVFFNSAAGNGDQILNMTNNHVVLRNLSIAAILFNIVLNAFLIPKYGMNGAAFSSLCTTFMFNLSTVILIRKKLGFYTFGR